MARIDAARAGATDVNPSSKAVLVTPLFLSLGLLLLVLPARRFEPGGLPPWFVDKHTQRLARGGYVAVGALLLAGVAIDLWVQAQLSALS